MYAIIDAKGTQIPVRENETVKIPRISTEPGKEVVFEKVLLLQNENEILVGKPYVEGHKVVAEVVSHKREPKVLVFKTKRRKNYRRLRGHKQRYTEIKIKKID